MQHARFRSGYPSLSSKSGPHSVSAGRLSLVWDTVCRLTTARLSRAGIGIVLALSIHCDGAQAGPSHKTPIAFSDPYAASVAEASQRFGTPVSWLRAVMQVESAGNAKAVSPKGAMGLMQLMPDTWSTLRVRYHLGSDPFDPHDNIFGGAAYLRELFDRFGATGFLAAYNAGPKRFEDYLAGLRPLRDETKSYVSTLARMLPDLQIGGAIPPLRVATDWHVSSLFPSTAAAPSPLNNAPDPPAPENATTAHVFALGPQSNELFVPVQLPDQR